MINLVHERTPMPEQSKDLRCKNFDEVALGYTPLEAVGEAMRCLNCREKPCVAGSWPGWPRGTLTGPMM